MKKKSLAIAKIREELPMIKKAAVETFKIRLLSEIIKNESGAKL